jgi:hypothetical protein
MLANGRNSIPKNTRNLSEKASFAEETKFACICTPTRNGTIKRTVRVSSKKQKSTRRNIQKSIAGAIKIGAEIILIGHAPLIKLAEQKETLGCAGPMFQTRISTHSFGSGESNLLLCAFTAARLSVLPDSRLTMFIPLPKGESIRYPTSANPVLDAILRKELNWLDRFASMVNGF